MERGLALLALGFYSSTLRHCARLLRHFPDVLRLPDLEASLCNLLQQCRQKWSASHPTPQIALRYGGKPSHVSQREPGCAKSCQRQSRSASWQSDSGFVPPEHVGTDAWTHD